MLADTLIAIAMGVEGKYFALQIVGEMSLMLFDYLGFEGASTILGRIEFKASSPCFYGL